MADKTFEENMTRLEEIVNTGMLRCMSKACYEEKPKGHYGLVLKDYAHFTSPIRRTRIWPSTA